MSITVAQLIEELQKHPADMIVCVEADHGQSAISASWAGVVVIEDAEVFMMEALDDEVAEDHHVRMFCIQGY